MGHGCGTALENPHLPVSWIKTLITARASKKSAKLSLRNLNYIGYRSDLLSSCKPQRPLRTKLVVTFETMRFSEDDTRRSLKSGDEEKSPQQHSSNLDAVEIKPEDDAEVTALSNNDQADPKNWSALRKWSTVIPVALMSTLGIIGTTIIVPAAPQVITSLHVTSSLDRTLLVSIWDLGEGVGPFLVAPLSEAYGRLPIYHIGNLLGLLCAIAMAFSVNISMLMGFRFLSGFVVVAQTLAPVVTADLFIPEQRGRAMSVGLGLRLLGPFIAPEAGGFISKALGWRWTVWVVAIAIGVIGAISIPLVRETYPTILLQRKTSPQQKRIHSSNLRTRLQISVNKYSILRSVTRPVEMMFTSPIIFLISSYTALAYGLSYLILTTLTETLEATYNFDHGTVGLAFLGRAIGNVVGLAFYGFTSDRYITYRKKISPDGKLKPEDRLVHMVLGAITLPLGLFMYAWTLAYRVHFLVPVVATGVVGFSMVLSVLPTENYLCDVYEVHAASAIVAGVILRALSGALLPLCGPPLYNRLGLGWGNSVLAFITAAFVPMLVLLMRYGDKLRKREKFE